MRRLSLSLLTLFVPAFFSCQKSGDDTNILRNDAEAKTRLDSNSTDGAGVSISESVNKFAWDLYLKNRETSDFVFSPQSINSTLGMLYLGAKGDTKDEMQRVLYFNENPEVQGEYYQKENKSLDGSPLVMVNRVWVREGTKLNSGFTNKALRFYSSEFKISDFISKPEKSITKINDWVSKKTSSKINGLLQKGSIGPDTNSVLVNAIHFKGTWISGFEKEGLKKEFNTGESKEEVDYIRKNNGVFHYFENDLLQMVSIEFKKDFVMEILLPKESLSTLEEQLNFDNYTKWSNELRKKHLDFLRFPKFKQDCKLALLEQLKSLGINAAFQSENDGFSEICSNFYISNIAHKATIDVNEQGAKAAAATSTTASDGISNNPEMDINKPFIYLIKNKNTQTIAFIGKVSNPKYN